MSEQENQVPVLAPQRVYLKDLSLELPNAPKIFLENEAPKIDIRLEPGVYQELGNNYYEVAVTLTVTATVKDQVAYLVEAKQAGIFFIEHIPADQMPQVLGILCPNIIYPYLRANVEDQIQRAGYPGMILPLINFDQIFEQQQAAEQAPATA